MKPLALLGIAMLLVMIGLSPAGPLQASPAYASSVIYNLYATDAYVKMADGTVVYNYGFVGGRQGKSLTFQKSFTSNGAAGGDNMTIPGGAPAPTGGPITANEQAFKGQAQFPGPLIYAAVGDVVEIRLKNLGVSANPNAPNDPHTIHLHGLDVDAANDGVPETSIGAVPANANIPGAGNVVVYMFSPKKQGTYFYHCHQEADIHVQMGMYGALIIYDPTDPGAQQGPGTYGRVDGWNYDKDFVVMLTDIDLRQHASENGGPNFNPVDYKPQYWFINGLSFPNTIHASGGPVITWNDWIAAHPGYDPLITGSVNGNDKVLLRMINMGFETQPMHMHGYHGKIIGSDQRAWTFANPPGTDWGQGLEKNTLTIGSGEAYNWLIKINQQAKTSTYPGATQSRANGNTPVVNTQTQFPPIPVPGGNGAKYIGGPQVCGLEGTGANTDNNCAGVSQMFPFHNHDDYKATNNGVYPGGQFTFIVPAP